MHEIRILELTEQLVSHPAIDVVDMWQINNEKELEELFEKVLAEGKEGLIVKDMHGVWENKRSKHWVKMKQEQELDLKVVDYKEGTGRMVGMLGALIVENRDGTLQVNVGTGYSDELRKEIWTQCQDGTVIGRIVAVKYNERIKARNAEVGRLFLPVFVEFREDKNEVDL